MQYNFHNEKYQMKDIVGIHREQFREIADQSKYHNNVDLKKTERNVYDEIVPNGRNWYAAIKEAKDHTVEMTGRAVRKDAVVLCSTVESVPPSWPRDVSTRYFREKVRWYEHFLQTEAGLDPGSMKSLVIHYDETSPHATYDWIPLKDGRLQAKNILTKQVLQRLQDEGQKFTMNWIEAYNLQHPDRQIERLEPSGMGIKRQYLDDLAYKRMKDEEAVAVLKQEHTVITEKIAAAHEKLEDVRQQTMEQLTLQKTAEGRAEAAENHYSELVEKITGAPSLASYEAVTNQNESLKVELSFKDKLIDTLQESVKQWKEKAELWKNRFMDVAHSFGQRLMKFAGYDIAEGVSIPEFPSPNVSDGIRHLQENSERINPAALRIIPDSEMPGTYSLVFRKKSGEYEKIKAGFNDRESAEDWRRNYSGYALSVSEDLIESRSHTIDS